MATETRRQFRCKIQKNAHNIDIKTKQKEKNTRKEILNENTNRYLMKTFATGFVSSFAVENIGGKNLPSPTLSRPE